MKTLFAWIYGLQCFFVAPWFLGAFYRGEMSSIPWREYVIQADRHGTGNALFAMYLFAIFYSLPLVLSLTYLPKGIIYLRGLLSIWIAYSVFLFLPSLLEAIRSGWLFVIWAALSFVVFASAVPLIQELRRIFREDA